MPSPASFSGAPRRVHRTALGQLLALWGALPRAMRRFAGDFAAVFAEEGREVPRRLAWSAVASAIAGILVVSGWLLACAATASWMVTAYGWRWDMALYVVALANLAPAVIAILAAWHALKTPFFPYTSYELHRLRNNEGRSSPERAGSPAEAPAPLADLGPRERALLRSEAELKARLSEVRRVTPRLIATPSVIAATAGAGWVAGYITTRRKSHRKSAAGEGPHNAPLTRQLVNIAFGQLSSLAIAAALREFQRRARSDGPAARD